jgi:tetratricopeptide (TPR) repeat protein
MVLSSSLALEGSGRAQADNVEEARAYVNKATAAYALNHYAVAAENFEKAFELKPDPPTPARRRRCSRRAPGSRRRASR